MLLTFYPKLRALLSYHPDTVASDEMQSKSSKKSTYYQFKFDHFKIWLIRLLPHSSETFGGERNELTPPERDLSTEIRPYFVSFVPLSLGLLNANIFFANHSLQMHYIFSFKKILAMQLEAKQV